MEAVNPHLQGRDPLGTRRLGRDGAAVANPPGAGESPQAVDLRQLDGSPHRFAKPAAVGVEDRQLERTPSRVAEHPARVRLDLGQASAISSRSTTWAKLAGRPIMRAQSLCFQRGERRFQRLAGHVRPRHPFAVARDPSDSVTRTTRFSLTDRSNDACRTTFLSGTAILKSLRLEMLIP